MGGSETGPPSVPENPSLPMPEWLSGALVHAMCEHLFKPTLVNVSMHRTPAGDYIPAPIYNDPPLASLAAVIFYQHRDEILSALWERVGPETVAEHLAGKVLRGLEESERSTYYRSGTGPDAASVRKRVGELVAQGLADRQLAEWDARQAGSEAGS